MTQTRLIGILATLVAALIALVAATALYTSVRVAKAERAAHVAVAEATEYSRALDSLKDAVLDAETGQRGYLLTGNRDYLKPYLDAQNLIGPDAREDWAATALRSGEDEELRQFVDFKLTELDETIRLFESGNPNAALAMIQTDRGRELMRDIRTNIRQRQTQAQARAQQAQALSEAYFDRSAIVSALLGALLGLAAIMAIVTLYLWTRTDKAVAEAEEASETADRIEIIAHELNHRMKNMFAVAQGMIRQSARGRGKDVEDFAAEASARLVAMSQAYSVKPALDAEQQMPTDQVIQKVINAQLLNTHRFKVDGQHRNLRESAITPLALILHEWTTNAMKYGAWRADHNDPDNAQIHVHVNPDVDDHLELIWDETYARQGQAAPSGQGYGSKLVRACAAQLGGTVSHDWHDNGVRITLTAKKDRL